MSSAGKRAGLMQGTRTGLWHETARAIGALRPQLVLLENVRGLLSARGDDPTAEHLAAEATAAAAKHLTDWIDRRHALAVRQGRTDDARNLSARRLRAMGCRKRALDRARRHERRLVRAIGTVLGALADLGFDAAGCGLRAADVGAPHGRWRIFILAWPADAEGIAWGGGDGDGLPAAPDPQHAQLEGVGQLPGLRGGPDPCPDVPLLPTPDTGESLTGHGRRGGRAGNGRQSGNDLEAIVAGLLPTPTTRDHKDNVIRREPHRPDDVDTLARALTLLPTPAVNDMGTGKTPEDWDAWTDRMKAEHGNGNGHGASLSIEAMRLLPTPVGGDARNSRQSTAPNARADNDTLCDTVVKQDWGKYAAAIQRWEQVTRPAPAPTEIGPKGNPRLSCHFDEWLMGLAAGWITDVPDITHNEALKLCGNGVVWQQGVAALRWLLAVRAAHMKENAA